MFKIIHKTHVEMTNMYKSQCWKAWVISLCLTKEAFWLYIVWHVYVCEGLWGPGSLLLFCFWNSLFYSCNIVTFSRKNLIPLTIQNVIGSFLQIKSLCEHAGIIQWNGLFVTDLVLSVHVTWTIFNLIPKSFHKK